MKTLIATIAVLWVAGMPAYAAQDSAQTQADQARQRFEQIKERLQLTPDQVEQVRPVLTDEMEKLKALRDQHSGEGQSRRARLKLAREARDIQSKADDQLKKILSKSQMDEMKKIREERRQQRSERSGQ